ncbi:MAG: hypothetical protein KGL39_40585 [Patescibacteria group bacterium]|nr:hypothetical protein [Patescibacteria group bacterium]
MTIEDVTEVKIGETTYRLARYRRFISLHAQKPGQLYRRVIAESMDNMRALTAAINDEIEKGGR